MDGIVARRDFRHRGFAFAPGDAFDPRRLGTPWPEFEMLLQDEAYLTYGAVVRSFDEVLEANHQLALAAEDKADEAEDEAEPEDEPANEAENSDEAEDESEGESVLGEAATYEHVGGGWYEIKVGDTVIDKVQGEDAAKAAVTDVK